MLLSLLISYLLCLLIAFLLQRKLIYFPETRSLEDLQALAEQSNLMLWPSQADYRGLMARNPPVSANGTIIVFHGNAGSALNRRYYAEALEKLGYRVILAEYPGYGARPGRPSEQTLVADALATVRLASSEFAGPLWLWGESLGGGVVAGVVGNAPDTAAGIVLLSPFDSLAKIAGHHYWYFLGRWLIRDKFDNIKNLRDYAGAVAVIMAGRDEIIPNKNTLALFQSLPGKKKLWQFPEAGHNSLPLSPQEHWWQAVMRFVGGQNGESR